MPNNRRAVPILCAVERPSKDCVLYNNPNLSVNLNLASLRFSNLMERRSFSSSPRSLTA